MKTTDDDLIDLFCPPGPYRVWVSKDGNTVGDLAETFSSLVMLQHYVTRYDEYEGHASDLTISPDPDKPPLVRRLDGFQGDFIDLLIEIEQRKSATPVDTLINEAEKMLDAWRLESMLLLPLSVEWVERLRNLYNVQRNDRRISLALGNAETLHRLCLNAPIFIDGWRGVAQETAKTGRVPDFD